MLDTYKQYTTETKLKRIAWLSDKDKSQSFDRVLHHVNGESLKANFHKLDRNKACGIDGITKQKYGENRDENVEGLVTKMRGFSYLPGDVRIVDIPKDGQAGKTRPIGIANLEDKIVQMCQRDILEAIYDPIFYENNYGFRRGKSCHDAIKDLTNYLHKNRNSYVIDVDIENFFGSIDHKILRQFIETKIKDFNFNRYVARLLKSGILQKMGTLKSMMIALYRVVPVVPFYPIYLRIM